MRRQQVNTTDNAAGRAECPEPLKTPAGTSKKLHIHSKANIIEVLSSAISMTEASFVKNVTTLSIFIYITATTAPENKTAETSDNANIFLHRVMLPAA